MPLVAQLADLVPELGAALRVEAGGRLVEEDQRRPVDEAERRGRAGGAGRPTSVPVGRSAQPVSSKRSSSRSAAARASALPHAVQPGLQHEFLAAGHRRVGAAALGDVADAAAHAAGSPARSTPATVAVPPVGAAA